MCPIALFLVSGAQAEEPSGAQADEVFEEEQEPDRRFYASAGIGFDFTRGDYGEGSDTDIYSPSLFAKLEYEPVTFRVLVPYVVIDGSDNFVVGEGAAASRNGNNSTNHGIGDIVTSLTYTYFSTREYVPIIDVSTKVKIPTASTSDGIGTGHADVTFGLEVTEVLGPVSLFGSAGYRIKTGSQFDNIWLTSLGTNVRLGRLVSVGFAYDFRQSSTDGTGDSHEIAPFASIRLSDRWRFGPYAVIGLSTNSPDWGVGSTLSVNF